jgi:hypothetical protein
MHPLIWALDTFAFLILYVVAVALWMRVTRTEPAPDWRRGSREPVGLAPDAATTPEAVVQVYAARALSWRGFFAVHPWVAVKRTDAHAFTVYEVSGWWLGRSGTSVLASNRPPDGRWFGNRPQLLADRRGAGVDTVIDHIETAVRDYPWKDRYRVWPGPNSNTFIAHVARAAPQLRLALPATAIGKDYLGLWPMARLPSGTGVQLNVLGIVGLAVGLEEGIEMNVLGLTFGIDPCRRALKLPLIGRIALRPARCDAKPPLDDIPDPARE